MTSSDMDATRSSHSHNIRVCMRADLEREAANLAREEAKLLRELKATAKVNPDAAKPLAKQLVKLRQRQTQIKTQVGHIKGVGIALKSQAAMHTTATAMGTTAAAMGKVNASMEPQKMMATMQEFSKQNAKMGMASEMMEDAIDDMFEGAEGDADELVDQVCSTHT